MSSTNALTVRRYQNTDAKAVVDLWNAHLGHLHPLTPALLAQSTGRYVDPAWFLVAERAGAVCGFVWAKPAVWSTAFGAHLCGFAVAPVFEGQGIGSRLWTELTDTLRDAGVTRLRLGGEPRQLLPGVPQGASLATWRFLRARGATFGGLEHDLHVDLAQVPSFERLDVRLPAGYRCVAVTEGDALAEELVAFVDKAFPGRWAAEVRERLEPTLLLTLTDPQNCIIGFASTFYQNSYIGPSLNWATSLPDHVATTSAGLGPIGLAADVRGQGLGLAFLVACANNLRDRGARHLFIDWTDLVDFYARIGAHVWRTYQSAYVDL